VARAIKIRGYYEAKLRKPGDRVDENGKIKEGGKTFSRHYEANNYHSAKDKAHKFAEKFNAVVVSVTKVHPDDVIGRSGDWGWVNEFLRSQPKPVFVNQKRDVILNNNTLDSIVFNRRK